MQGQHLNSNYVATSASAQDRQASFASSSSNTSRTASVALAPGSPSELVSPTTKAFENLSVEKGKEKLNQNRRHGIYGIKELMDDDDDEDDDEDDLDGQDQDSDDESYEGDEEDNENDEEQYDGQDTDEYEDEGDADEDGSAFELRWGKRQKHQVHNKNLKRKREVTISAALPTPMHPYKRTNKSDFNVFSGFLQYPELCLYLTTHLAVDDLISLYAISRDFHTIVDARFTTVILSIASRRAKESSRVFPFRCYRRLCRVDPAARLPHPNPQKAAANIPRMVPSFRWLKMIMYREAIVHEIMVRMAEDGVPMPRRCRLAMKKIWFMMDIPDNARRVGYIHNTRVVTGLDLYFILCTIVKMDMRFNDPVGPEKCDGLRRLLFAQKSMSVWLRVLKGEMWTNRLDVLRAWLRWKYNPAPFQRVHGPGDDLFGVPIPECGLLSQEYWGHPPPGYPAAIHLDAHGNTMPLTRPDQIVLREVIRRGLRFRGQFLKCMLYGYIDLRTLQSFKPRKMSPRISEWDDLEYSVDGLWGTGVGAASSGYPNKADDGTEEPAKDDLLDLAPVREVSELCVERQGMGEAERKVRKDLDAMSSQMMHLWENAGQYRSNGNGNGNTSQ